MTPWQSFWGLKVPGRLIRWCCATVIAGFLIAAAPAFRVILTDFEKGFPVASLRAPGFLPSNDKLVAVLTDTSTKRGGKFARLFLNEYDRAVFLQYGQRRRYLATGGSGYEPGTANCLAFRLRVPPTSYLLSEQTASRFGVWTYHWRSDDVSVGGANGTSGTTDSMMHGYANFCVSPEAGDRWLRVELSPSAFKQQREYYHLYAAQAVTGDLEFFPSLRQLQFVLLGSAPGLETVDLDDIELFRKQPTAAFEPAFVHSRAAARGGDVRVPVSLRNPSSKTRRYRFYASSVVGASREALNRAFAEADTQEAPTAVQKAVGGIGGVGAVELYDPAGTPILSSAREVELPPGGVWSGVLLVRVRPEMLGEPTLVSYRGHSWLVARDTLTTSVIAWDPLEPPSKDMALVLFPASNSDDGVHPRPPGFPQQFRPPLGWRSEDVPADQVGGYFVAEIQLE